MFGGVGQDDLYGSSVENMCMLAGYDFFEDSNSTPIERPMVVARAGRSLAIVRGDRDQENKCSEGDVWNIIAQ